MLAVLKSRVDATMYCLNYVTSSIMVCIFTSNRFSIIYNVQRVVRQHYTDQKETINISVRLSLILLFLNTEK